MAYYLGIDGGGTNTRAVLLEGSGRVLGVGFAGSANNHNIGVEAATANLVLATQAAWMAAGLKFAPATRAFLGLCAIGSNRDVVRMTAAAEGTQLAAPGCLEVANDLHNALAGGLDNRPGIALIGGTGSNGLGRDATGRSFMCGGWGWLLGDQGSAYGLAFEALRASAKAADGRAPATHLLLAAQDFFGLAEPNEMMAHLYQAAWDPGTVAAFAPVVVRLAGKGDATALRILEDGARELGHIVATIATTLDFPHGPDVVLLGGCITSGPPYQPLVEAAIERACPLARIRPAAFGPLHGAALNVLRRADLVPTEPIVIPA